MQLRYIGHASFVIDVAGRRIVCDPWWNGPAFAGQWFQYPAPRPDGVDDGPVDFVFISNGHEDHLHVPTLRGFRRDTTLIVPRLPETGLRDFLRSLGFERIVELGHGERRRLAPGLDAALYRNRDDSILVLEGDGRTLVNVNDALHAAPRHIIDHFCDLIRARHPRIDTALVGYGISTWFPAGIQITDDVGYEPVVRERAMADGFAYVARRLGARLALPIGGSQVFVDDASRWINAERLRAVSPCEVLRAQGGHTVQTAWLAPGDRVVGDTVRSMGGRRPQPEEIDAAVRTVFALAVAERRQRSACEAARASRLERALSGNARRRARRVLGPDGTMLCRIDLRDMPEWSLLVEGDAKGARVTRCDRLRLAPMVLTTRFEILEALAFQDYGDEVLTRGCGATLQVRQRDVHAYRTILDLLGRRTLAARRRDSLFAWLWSPRRRFDAWKRDRHWARLAARLRRGQISAVNDPDSTDPDLWSPLRQDSLSLAAADR